MKAVATMGISIHLWAIALFISMVNTELVPVYMWQTTKSNEHVPALNRINADTLTEILFQKIDKTNPYIAVFAEENLSPEDFIEQERRMFLFMSEYAASSQAMYLPLVEDPVETVRNLATRTFTEVSIDDLNRGKEMPKTDVIVNLNDAKDDEDRSNMLKRHDELIEKMYNELRKNHEHVLIIFTGYHSSWVLPDQVKHLEKRASGDDDGKEDPRKYIKKDQLQIFIENSIISNTQVEGSKDVKTDYYTIDDIIPKSATMFEVTTNSSSVTLTFNLTLDTKEQYWYVSSISVGDDHKIELNEAYAPDGFSYHCDRIALKAKETEVNNVKTTEQFIIRGLQIQLDPPERNVTKFGDAYDCVGFTTAPIWSGLFVTFILAIIMTIGLTMMMDIKTMDRFDDPKGKTIIVNATE